MNKALQTVYFMLIVVLIAGMGFLGYLYSDLNRRYHAMQTGMEGQSGGSVQEELEQVKLDLKDYAQALTALSENVDGMDREIADLSDQKFLSAPQYKVTRLLFTGAEAEGTKLVVVGDKKGIIRWIGDNEIYLDYVLKKGFSLDYDKVRRAVQVTDVVRDSFFYQMGFRKDDRILSINGKILTKGLELRRELLNVTNKNIVILRGTERMNLDVSYVDKVVSEVTVEMTKNEFDDKVTNVLATLQLEPITKDGQNVGLKIVGVDSEGVFSQMKFQPEDIITSVNGKAVTDDRLESALKTSDDYLELGYIRNDKPDTVQVNFR